MDELRCLDIKEICNKLKEKYNISKDDWTISYDYDVLYNYMGFRLKFLSNCGHIRYDKESTDPTTGGKKPNGNAQYGAFNTGLKVDENIFGPLMYLKMIHGILTMFISKEKMKEMVKRTFLIKFRPEKKMMNSPK